MDNGHPFYHRHSDFQANVGLPDSKWKRRFIQSSKRSQCRYCFNDENVENCRYSTSTSSTSASGNHHTKKNNSSIPSFRSDLLRCEISKCKELGLPLNPHTWSWDNVLTWLRNLSKLHQLTVDYDKFMMNGKGLCFMTLSAFKSRCPRAGKLLHTDLQRKMIAHVYLLVLQNHASKKPLPPSPPESPTTNTSTSTN